MGYHTPMWRRVSVAYLAGIEFIQERYRTKAEITPRLPIPLPVGVPSRSESEFFNYRGAATVGVDADLSITSHLSVVPQVRAQVFVGALSIRPGVGVRLSF